MPDVWTLQEVANKADWEGGLDELYRWGSDKSFTTNHTEFNHHWQNYCYHMKQLVQLESILYEILPEPGDDDSDDDDNLRP